MPARLHATAVTAILPVAARCASSSSSQSCGTEPITAPAAGRTDDTTEFKRVTGLRVENRRE